MYSQPFHEVVDYQTKVGLGELESEKVPKPRVGPAELETERGPHSTVASTSSIKMKYHAQGDLHELPPEGVFFATTQSATDSKTSAW